MEQGYRLTASAIFVISDKGIFGSSAEALGPYARESSLFVEQGSVFCFPRGTGFWVGGEITLGPPDNLTGRSVLCYCWGVQLSSDTEVASPHKRYPSLSRLFSLEGNRGVSAAGPPGDAVGWGGI